MKKILLTLLMVGFWTIGSGFTTATTAITTSAEIIEVVAFGYDQQTATALGTTIEDLEDDIAEISDKVQENLISLLVDEIDDVFSLSAEQAQIVKENISVNNLMSDNEVGFYVIYKDMSVWNLFCENQINQATTTSKKNLFSTTTYTQMPIKISMFGSGEKDYLFKYVQKFFINQLVSMGYDKTILQNSFESEISYTYATTSKRLHSNAEKIEADRQAGLYYHTWQVDDLANASMKVWQTWANTLAWYCLALGITAVFAVVLVVVAKNKEKSAKKHESPKFDDNDTE